MRIFLIALAVFMWGASGPYLAPVGHALAQPFSVCALHEQMMSRLKKGYEEQKIADGLNSKGVIIEILVSPAGTFTILETDTNGWSCVIASGTGYQVVNPSPGDSV